jgi:hypothetical protein
MGDFLWQLTFVLIRITSHPGKLSRLLDCLYCVLSLALLQQQAFQTLPFLRV